MMNLEQLKYFIAVVEEGTISGAARRLHMSQPPLSLQLKNLEAEYDVKLFERGARQIRLTEAGKSLYSYAQKMMEIKDAAEDDLNNLKVGRKGSLRIGVVSSGSCEEFFNGIAKFKKSYPDIHFNVQDGNTYQLLDALEMHRIELSIVRTPFLSSGLDVRAIREDPMMVIGQAEYMHRLPQGEIRLSDLLDLPLVIYHRWEKIIRENAEKEKLDLNIYCINDDARTSLQWADAGFGVAIAPYSALPLAPHLEYRTFSEAELRSKICIVRRSDSIPSEAAKALFEIFA